MSTVQHIGAGDSATYLDHLHNHASFEVAAKYGNDLMLIGTFNDAEAAAQAAEPHNAKASALYVTVHRLGKWATNPAKLTSRKRASDADFTHRRYLYADVDPVRPAGTSATEAEHCEALKRTDQIVTLLTNRFHFPDPAIYGDSGNGAALMYRLGRNIDSNLYKRAHSVICDMFTDATVEIDKTVTDLARLTPLFGTVKAKGEATPDRPHRTTSAEINTDADEVTPELLAVLAELYKPQAQTVTRGLITFGDLQLPQPAIEFITDPPTTGQRNRQLFNAARAMRDSGLPEAMAHGVLTPVALAAGLTTRETADAIHSTYKNCRQSTTGATLAQINAWAHSMSTRTWHGRTGATDFKTAMAMAAIARKVGKLEIAASCRDVAELASIQHLTAAASLKRHCMTYHTLRCTNLRTRETGQARRYKLVTTGVAEIDTFIEGRSPTPEPPASLNVSISATPHDAATLRAGGGVLAQVITALLEHEALNISQLSRLTGRNHESIKRVLTLLQDAKGATRTGNIWSLTTTDQAGILSALDRIALATKVTGRNEKRAAQHKAQRAEFRDVDAWADGPQSVCDRIRGKRIKLQREAIARAKGRKPAPTAKRK